MKITIKKPVEVEVEKIYVKALVRHPEDAYINEGSGWDSWEEEDNILYKMPFLKQEGKYTYWKPLIDVNTGNIINWPTGVSAKICYKVVDEFACDLIDDNNSLIFRYDGYVPSFMAIDDNGYGDYIYLTITKDGHIEGWTFDEDDVNNLINSEY